MKSWKTTLSGVLATVGSVAAVLPPETLGSTGEILKILLPIGIAALGVTSKDFNVTGK